MHAEIWWGVSKEGDQYGDRGVDGRIILKRIFKNCVGRHRLDCPGSGWRQVAVVCECGNEPSGLIKCGKFSD